MTTPAAMGAVAMVCAASPATPQAPRPAVRDSAAVRIVEHRNIKDAPTAFNLAARPRFTLGGLRNSPDEEFDSRHPFLAPVRLSDGHIAVGDWSSIKFYDAKGTFLRSVGRSGSGPGEFGQLRQLCRLKGDTLLAIGYSDRRLSLWAPDGAFLRAVPPLGFIAGDPCFDDGSLLAVAASSGRASASATPGQARYVRVRLDGVTAASLGWLPVEEYGLPVFRIVSVVATGNSILVADGKAYDVRTYDLSGRLRRILRVRDATVPIPDVEWNRLIARSTPAVRARADALRQRPLYPAYAEVRADPAGRTWVHDYRDRTRWVVFDVEGALLGTVTVPTFDGRVATIAAFETDELVLRYHDADGAVVLGWYRLIPVRR